MTETVLSQIYGCNMDLYFCGERSNTPFHEFGPSTRSHFLICLVTQGEATLFGREKNVTFGKGDFIIVFPDVACHYQAGESWALKCRVICLKHLQNSLLLRLHTAATSSSVSLEA